MAARATPSVDLFAWREVADARAAAEEAAARRERAAERYRFAPHGEVLNRLNALQEATEEALRAALALAEITRKSLH
jgi:hypothetical protein